MAAKNELMKLNSGDISLLLHSELPSVIEMPFGRLLFLGTINVAGIQYRENIDTILAGLDIGDVLTMVREPHNEYDKRAIALCDASDNLVGYVPRGNGQVLANLMDAGKSLIAVLSKVEYDVELLEKALEHLESVKDEDNRYSGFWYYPNDMVKVNIFMED